MLHDWGQRFQTSLDHSEEVELKSLTALAWTVAHEAELTAVCLDVILDLVFVIIDSVDEIAAGEFLDHLAEILGLAVFHVVDLHLRSVAAEECALALSLEMQHHW